MGKRVGIPRALYYYQYFILWRTFLEELGAEVVLSDFTSKKILDDGVKSCVDEACLPVKLYYGHIINLKDRVDYLFIPRFTSVSRNEYICPKFGGLPDMIRHSVKGLPIIIDTEINLRKKKSNSLISAIEIGSYFTNDISKIKNSYNKAISSYKEFRNTVKQGVLPSDLLEHRLRVLNKTEEKTLNIALIGHVYNLYDSYINMNMIYKLKNEGINVITIDMVDAQEIDEKAATLHKKMFWNFGRKAVGGALQILERKDIDGIIYVMSFGCGVDSFVCDMVERRIRNRGDVPFTVFTLDEHSGEAGMNTRLEAFIDMIRWRIKDEDYISAHG
ncbi:MAG: hypothetical protein K0R31_1282 [Clostridiales bacterium]|jgi:predicted nucleotide-binding protein (sugar kinase/HSP70/actin superfamily)|nr:hypothetical protein [Clostridiales bacterium]